MAAADVAVAVEEAGKREERCIADVAAAAVAEEAGTGSVVVEEVDRILEEADRIAEIADLEV